VVGEGVETGTGRADIVGAGGRPGCEVLGGDEEGEEGEEGGDCEIHCAGLRILSYPKIEIEIYTTQGVKGDENRKKDPSFLSGISILFESRVKTMLFTSARSTGRQLPFLAA